MMRTVFAFCLLAVPALAGCDKLDTAMQAAPINTATVEGNVRGRRGGGEEIRVWRDPETGCQYLVWERRRTGSMTPRLKADGRPLCNP